MTEITREMMAELAKKHESRMMTSVALLVVMFGTAFLIWRNRYDLPDELFLPAIAAVIGMTVLPFILVIRTKNKLSAMNSGIYQEALNAVSGDFTSDMAVNTLFEHMGWTEDFSDKAMITLLLCSIYRLRGQYNEAIGMLESINRSRFIEYPVIGLRFYSTVTDIYTEIGGNESVLAAFADAEPFIDECAGRNYKCCAMALGIIINAERAKENYRKALELRLMKNEYENRFNAVSDNNSQPTPFQQFERGMVFFETAELFYLSGDCVSAAKYLDIGGPMIAANPAMLEKANRLSAELREKTSRGVKA